jgi:chemotaxis receptor (MCP) glutamine deamidase CheD/DNA-binding NarL/FixJ family response regulator
MKIKILIVDDQPLVLQILKRGLAKYSDFDVVGTATDGQLALNEVKRLEPDVIILDMEMPRMNGIEFLKNLMPVNPIPTVVLSALTGKDNKITEEAFNSGAVDFLQKPSGSSQELGRVFAQLATKIKIAYTKDVSDFKKEKHDYKIPSTSLDRSAKTDKIILGMGAHDIIDDSSKVMKIYALGSCIGLAMFCKENSLSALAHIALPSSKTDPEKAERMPGYFADTAIDILMNNMLQSGCQKSSLVAKIAGGAKTKVELGDFFSIGQKNILAVKAGLIKKGIKLQGDDTGGNISRTVEVQPGKLEMSISYLNKEPWKI